MKYFLFRVFKKRFCCSHKNALENTLEGYCPDCGAYLRKYFYVIRCKSCEIKRKGQLHLEEIVPGEKFCTNCGAQDFYIAKLDKITITDIQFAIHTKEECVPNECRQATQVWSEIPEEKRPQLRLLKDNQRKVV